MITPDNTSGSSEVTLSEIGGLLLGGKWWILASTLLGLALGLAWALTATPIYRAEVLLAPTSERGQSGGISGLRGQLGGFASLAGMSIGGAGGREVEAVATLESRALTDQFVSDEKLLPVLFGDRWDAKQHEWVVDDPAQVPTLWDANKLFVNKIRTVEQDGATGLVTLSIEWKDPQQAAHWASELVSRTNERMRDRAITSAERNLAYLKQQLEQNSIAEIRTAIYRLIESELKASMLAQGDEEYAFRVLDPAVVPQEPVRPQKKVIVLLGLVLGFMLSSFAVMVVGFSRRR